VDNLKIKIISYLKANPLRSYKTKELARALEVPKQGEEYQAIKRVLRDLQNDDVIGRVEGRKWGWKKSEKILEGIIEIPSKGSPSVRIANSNLTYQVAGAIVKSASNGDAVRIRIVPARNGEINEEVEILEIPGRWQPEHIGNVKSSRGQLFFARDGRNTGPDIPIRKHELHGAKVGDKVIAKLRYDQLDNVQVSVIEVIGRSGIPSVELLAIAKRFGLSTDFPSAVKEEVEKLPREVIPDDFIGRLDLRDKICFTIDPEDAKDFDDALSIELNDEGDYVLGVHIADVSHYVKPESPMDTEAFKRGTSVYLIDSVIPMLPERISNQLCSLQEGEDRLAYTVFLTLNSRGTIKKRSFHKSVIHSKRRFTYEDVEAIIESGGGDFREEILLMYMLATVLIRKRFQSGGIDFAVPEVKFVLDSTGYPEAIIPKKRLRSMRLVEEFMLLANKTVAESFAGSLGRSTGCLYRVHDIPDPARVVELISFIHHLGIKASVNPTSSKSFQEMMNVIVNRPESNVIQDMTIRSMAKAVYSEKNIGHFGLGFNHYTHFTSPIRRYPDLIVHRLLASLINSEDQPYYSSSTLGKIAEQSSTQERLAIEAERESRKVKEVEYMARHLGDTFTAVINGVMSYGLYIELVDTLVEGLVHIRSLVDDFYEIDNERKTLVGRRRGKVYRLGQQVLVQVARVDLVEKQIDFVFQDNVK